MAKVVPAPLTRPLYEIAREIKADYRAQGKPVYFAAVPYLDATETLVTLDGKFYEDDAEGIVIRLVGNLGTWRGETATRVKAELRAALADYRATKTRRR